MENRRPGGCHAGKTAGATFSSKDEGILRRSLKGIFSEDAVYSSVSEASRSRPLSPSSRASSIIWSISPG